MNHEELAFVNQQLAGMLKSGLPLEGSLKQLSSSMRRGSLRTELEALEIDLAKGTPLKDALVARKLPDLYKHMLTVGAQANDLPGVLILMADHYTRSHTLRTKLKGLMVYPALVLVTALILSLGLAFVFAPMIQQVVSDLSGSYGIRTDALSASLWMVPSILFVLTLLAIFAAVSHVTRRRLRWWLPGLKDASLSRLAGSLELLVGSGVPLPEALALMAGLERGEAVNQDLVRWRELLSRGEWKPGQAVTGFKVIPPLFLWFVSGAEGEIARGFRQAANLYERRATSRADMILFAALPVSILLTGMLVLSQFWPVFASLTQLMDMLGHE